MNRDQLTTLLQAQSDLTRDADTFSVNEEAQVSMLLASQSGGPAPLNRVTDITLAEGWVEVRTEEDRYCLPYDLLVGIKIRNRKEAARASRAGFTA